jgi:MarR family transcriptional regulator, negative regulator of the multidrug operon emrRAB
MVLALADRMRDATEEACGLGGALPAALVCLHEFAGGRPIDALATTLRVTHSRAVRVVDRLAEQGLARRRPAPGDRRVVLVELTAAGGRAAQRVMDARAEVIDGSLGALSAAERRLLAELVGKVLAGTTTSRRDSWAICRMCDVHACGHHEGRCPVTRANDAREAAA